MSVTLKQTESAPANYGSDISPEPVEAWQRIESYVAHRWSERDVAWIVEGPGEWHPPLSPATIATIEVWSSAHEWESVEILASPCGGYYLPASGPYRFTGTAGDDGADVPAVVLEAVRRLYEYVAAKPSLVFNGASSETIGVGSLNISYRRSSSWLAMALQNSGAADLLRPYRKAG